MIHNVEIYHCQCCGAMLRQEPDRPVPSCCGRPMAKAAEDTPHGDDEPKDPARGKEHTPSRADPRRPR